MLPWILNNKETIKKVTMFAACVFLVTFFIFSLRTPVLAQAGDTFGLGKVGSTLPLGGEDIRIIIAKIIRIALSLLGIIAVSIMLYAGFIWMTSGGSEDKIATAKKTLINAVIGLTLIMASFAIVQFVLKSLQQATGSGDDFSGGRRGLNFDSYNASGALGRMVKDHYPLREQRNVKRNTRIAVTFREPVQPSSIIVDTNASGIYGDCIGDQAGANFNWGPNFCDQLNTSSVKIMVTGTSTTPVPAAALTILEGVDNNAYSFIFRPLSLLGSDQGEVDYTVDLTKNITKKSASTSIFASDRHGHYVWRFRTDTTIDVDPPHVVSVYPEQNTTGTRNSVVQINFNEPMDPTVVLGTSGPNSPFTNIIFGSQNVTGMWRVTNGYKTVEFLSDIACGQNSCGETMYCLPVQCAANVPNCANPYSVLVRSALTFSQNSFESVPFSGVADMAGNALDNGPTGTPDGIVNRRPAFAPAQAHTIGLAEKVPDNYFWPFDISNEIDRIAPYIQQVSPNLDQESVLQTATLTVAFSKRMQMYSFDDISLEEYPLPAELATRTPAFENLGNIWFRPVSEIVDGKTLMALDHREFGPQGTNFYYFPIIPSSVRSITQNCLYPGRGPFTDAPVAGALSPQCEYNVNANGVLLNTQNCVQFPAPITSSTDTACLQYTDANAPDFRASTSTCIDFLKRNDISPHERNGE